MLSTSRLTLILLALFVGLAFLVLNPTRGYNPETFTDNVPLPHHGSKQQSNAQNEVDTNMLPPSSLGCPNLVTSLQQQIIEIYQQELKDIRYVNIWGYLEKENKGDAAIWTGQQILLSTMGIDYMEACRFTHKECDIAKFTAALEAHRPHSAIVIAGGGNFNDFYWEDQPSRLKMAEMFNTVPIRSFPQSIHMTNPERIARTKTSFGQHPNLQLAARDQPSFDWLDRTFGKHATDLAPDKVRTVLSPDIAFMWGPRPDFRRNTRKTHNVLILARDDWEVTAGTSIFKSGEGVLDLGPIAGNVTYEKIDWKNTPTPGINPGPSEPGVMKETGKNQRAWAKAMEGFRMLNTADLVITDRLHGHIMSVISGTPHILLDSRLGKNLNYYNTWTKDCDAVRAVKDIQSAVKLTRAYFEDKKQNGVEYLG